MIKCTQIHQCFPGGSSVKICLQCSKSRSRSRARAWLHVASSTSSSRCVAVSLGGAVLSLFPPLCSEVWQPLGGSQPCPVTSPMLGPLG